MAKEGGFFSGSEKRDNRIAGNLGASTPVRIDNVTTRTGETFKRVLPNFGAGRVGEIRLKKAEAERKKPFFSQEVGQIASATTDLSGMLASDTSDETKFKNYMNLHGLEKNIKSYPPTMIRMMKQNMQDDEAEGRFKDGQFLNQAPVDTDTNVAFIKNPFQKQLDSPANIPVGDGMIKDSLNQMQKNLKQKYDTMRDSGIMSESDYQKNIKRLLGDKDKVEAPKENTLQKVGGFLANLFTGSQPVAAGTLDDNRQLRSFTEAQVAERPKLNYVNPDAKTMSLGEIGEAFRPRNLFGYKDKFGRFDDPGSPLDRDRQQTIQRVAQNFSSPITADARTIGQIRADQDARMRENARLRNESFQRGERVRQKSADVTYGTNMLSNPAFGFRDKMTDAAKAQYDRSAKDATEMARTDPSLGNVAMQTFNRISGFFGGPQGSLESVGERQLRLANKEINRPTYQKEAYARKFLGITNEQLKAKNLQQIRANAFARNQAFQNERVQRALDKTAVRRGENLGTGRDGGFGSGTSGQGMQSNPKGFSGYSRKSSPSSGTGAGTSTSRSRGGISKSTSRGQGGGPSSRSRGGVSRGGSKAKASGSRGQGSASKGAGKGGSFGGSRRSTNTSKSRRRCDIRTKIDIT